MRKSWVIWSVSNFLVAALMGLVLRAAFIWEISWLDYRNMMHGHSHVAMLGWAYLILFSLLVHQFVPAEKQQSRFYNRLFYFTQFTVLGMMVSFPIQGYGPVSITFSALHVLASYAFVYKIGKDMMIQQPFVHHLVRLGLFFMVFSTFGIWALGPIMAMGSDMALYQTAIQFYLHFQFNGWFLLTVLGLVSSILLTHGAVWPKRYFQLFIGCYLTGLILTFGHVLNWGFGHSIFQYLNSLGVIFQTAAFLFWLLPLVSGLTREMKRGTSKLLFGFGLISWGLKIIFQLALLFPAIAEISITVRPFMIGYIHLTMIGAVSGWTLWVLFMQDSWFFSGFSLKTWALGFMGTEIILFVQGAMYWMGWGALPYYHEVLFGVSCLLPLGWAGLIYYGMIQFPMYNNKLINI